MDKHEARLKVLRTASSKAGNKYNISGALKEKQPKPVSLAHVPMRKNNEARKTGG